MPTNRRKFLSHSCALGVAGTTVSSALLNLAFSRQAAAQTLGDYRAMVCILLAGGNDSYNMVVPNDSDQYTEYANIRADLALPQADLLPLAGTTSDGRNLALHPGMPEVQQLYGAGELGIIANVGTLLEAVDADTFLNGNPRVPLGLFSHADQIAQWQTATPDARVAQGWGGRIADLMQNVNASNGISMSISLGGSNVFQSGADTVEYALSAKDGAIGINAYDDGTDFGDFRKLMIDNLLQVEQSNLLRREYTRRLRATIDARQVYLDALAASTAPTTNFSPGPFSQSLKQIARTIAARDPLGACRQTFFVQVGGWDHHDDVIDNQAAMLPAISAGLKEFRDALVEMGVWNDVTTFTISDFGRTLTSNGKGSDHGWGGNHLVMGGAVSGGTVYGDYPLMSSSSPLDVGRGVLIPTTSVDEYFAELALWFGVASSDLTQVLPNVGNFYAPGSATPPLGFMS